MPLTNLDSFESILDITESIAGGAKQLTGAAAFRKYSWLTNARGLNVSGNFRGMVISANSKTAYVFVSKIENAAGNLAAFTALVGELETATGNVYNIVNGRGTRLEKASRISTEISATCFRAVLKLKVGVISAVSLSISLNKYVNPLCAFNRDCRAGSKIATDWLGQIKARLNSKIDQVVTGDGIYYWVTMTMEAR